MNTGKILYIGSPFFNYYKKIIEEFTDQGYSVRYYNDRPSENSLMKGIIKLKKSLMSYSIQKYFNNIISEIKSEKFDLVFIVNCKVFTPEMIKILRENQKSAKFVLYIWDSLKLYPDSSKVIPLFDRAYSFDSDDCDKIQDLVLLPLFYSKGYETIGKESSCNKEYDLVSVCTAHPNRYKAIHELFPKLEAMGIRIFSYMFINKLQYIYNKVFEKEFINAKKSEFMFKPLSEQDNLEVIKNSKAVFDMQHNMQGGLTIRTIETLGAKRKLITYNQNIDKYDFYTSENVLILNNNNWDSIYDFLQSDYVSIDDEVYNKYSIKQWVKTILGN